MTVTLAPHLLAQYQRATLYNSPYPAHDEGCAVDLYPGVGAEGATAVAPSPVAGEVLDTRTVRAPAKPYAVEHDHLVLVDVTEPVEAAGYVARLLHVEPAVAVGETVDVGDSLGRLIRSGFYAPWVDNHVHLGFRDPDVDPYRASGSVRLCLGVDVTPVPWDGTGTVVETGETYALLDAPAHPSPGAWAGVAATVAGATVVLDGGLPHYDAGGVLGWRPQADGGGRDAAVDLSGHRVGTTRGRTVDWDEVTVYANERPITGLSLFLARDSGFGVKLICPEESFGVGEDVTVRIE